MASALTMQVFCSLVVAHQDWVIVLSPVRRTQIFMSCLCSLSEEKSFALICSIVTHVKRLIFSPWSWYRIEWWIAWWLHSFMCLSNITGCSVFTLIPTYFCPVTERWFLMWHRWSWIISNQWRGTWGDNCSHACVCRYLSFILLL